MEHYIETEALQSLGLDSEECIYIDDYKPEADGARNVGFISFHLDRTSDRLDSENWVMGNLKHLIEYLEQYTLHNNISAFHCSDKITKLTICITHVK